jgi:hypothetical protein
MQRQVFSFLMAFAAVVMLGSAASAQQKFTAALNPLQETNPPVPPTSSQGRGSCVLTLNTAQTQFSITCEYSRLSSGLTTGGAHIHGPAGPGANAGVLFPLNPTAGTTSGTITSGPHNITAAQLADLRAKRWYVNLHTTNFPNGEIRGQIKIQTTPYDNDGDGRTDIKVYRPSTFTTFGIFSINGTIFSNVFGFAGESPVYVSSASDDYDADGRGDIVLTRVSGSSLVWRILQTGSNSVREVYWGLGASDFEMPADYDADGKTDVAVYRVTDGFWYILQSSNNQLRAEKWGRTGTANDFDIPMVGDFDGDGRNDLTVIRAVTGSGVVWFTRRSSDGGLTVQSWGDPATDFIFPPAQIDVDGDGRQDRMVIRDPNPAQSATGNQVTTLVLRSSDNGHFVLPFGLDTDAPFFGDYDGDGRTDFAFRRNISGIQTWFIALSSNNWNTAQPRVVQFGQTGDLSLAPEDESNDSPFGYQVKY